MAKMTPKNGHWTTQKATGPDHQGKQMHANKMATNADRKSSKPGVIQTRHSAHGTSAEGGCC